MPESYCRACDEVVAEYPWMHQSDHEGETVDVRQIERTNIDGERITEPDDEMGHYRPHMFVPVEGRLICPDCGAINVDADPENYP